MAGHKKRVDNVFQKGCELLEASSSLKREKIELEEKLLSRLLELQKVLEEVSDLQEKITSVQSEILSLREQIDKCCLEKLALEFELCIVRGSLESHDKDVEELRTEILCQSDLYNNLCLVHETLLEKAQKLLSKVIALRSGIQ